jgi:DNA-binding NarL/FixJ family response regulator
MSIRILLADDQELIRQGLCELIANENDMEVVAEAETGHGVVAHVIHHAPDIVVMDINMPDLSGIDVTKMILEHDPDIKVIALSIHSTRRYVKEMLAAGVSGYIVKHCAYEELINAVRIVIRNRPYLGSQIMGEIADNYVPDFSSDRRIFSIIDYSPERRSGFDRRCVAR